MATTNEVSKIPMALRDRMGKSYHIGTPSETLRYSILKDSPLALVSDSNLVELAKSTAGFSLRDLAELYTTTVDIANQREESTAQNTQITISDIKKALLDVRETNQIKVNEETKKTSNQKWENFNRYSLPLIGLGATAIFATVGLTLQYYQGQKNHTQAVATQISQFEETTKTNANNFDRTLQENSINNTKALNLNSSIATANAIADLISITNPVLGLAARPGLIVLSCLMSSAASNVHNSKK